MQPKLHDSVGAHPLSQVGERDGGLLHEWFRSVCCGSPDTSGWGQDQQPFSALFTPATARMHYKVL